MELTNYEKNVLRIIDREVTKAVARSNSLAVQQDISGLVLQKKCPDKRIHEKCKQDLRNFLPMLASVTEDQFEKKDWKAHQALLIRAIQSKTPHYRQEWMYATDVQTSSVFAKKILRQLHQSAVTLDMECMLPPPRRRERKPQPETLVGKRAARVAEKVAEWERKLKYAKTKLKKYRSKQKYYAKKGVTV